MSCGIRQCLSSQMPNIARKIGKAPKTETNAAPSDTGSTIDDAPDRLAASLGLTFHNLDLLRLALTHRSVLQDWETAAPNTPPPLAIRQSNERLEFLGDSVLGYVVADYLYARYPDAPEGQLTAERVALVRAERLVGWAREIGLADYLYLGQGEQVSSSARDRMLAGAFEAVIGALVIDRGLRETRKFLRRFIERDETALHAELLQANPKGRLQEIIQERYKAPPVYRTIHEEGPAHAKTFTCEVIAGGEPIGTGVGNSKRDAEQAAARAALQLLEAPPPVEHSPMIDPPRTRRRAG
jgi:ribonuclease III